MASIQSEAQAVERTLRATEAALHVVRTDPALVPAGRAHAESELSDVIRSLVQLLAPPAQDRMF